MTRKILSIALILMMILSTAMIPTASLAAGRIHSLRVRQDPFDQRLLYITWENEDDIECNITITRIESNGKAVNYEVVNQWVEDEQYTFTGALPITTYLVTVTQFGSGAVISKTISLGKAPSYSEAGAVCHGGTMYWVDRYAAESGTNPWSGGVTRYKYQTMSVGQFANMVHSFKLYGKSDYTHRYACYDQTADILYVLRGPDGKDVYATEENRQVSNGGANTNWYWYYPLDTLIRKMTGTDTLVQPGSYMFEVYFNDCRVSREEFVLTR